MKRKRKLREVAETRAVQAEVETSTKVGKRKKARKVAEKEVVDGAAAVAEPAPVQQEPAKLSKGQKKARKKARKAVEKAVVAGAAPVAELSEPAKQLKAEKNARKKARKAAAKLANKEDSKPEAANLEAAAAKEEPKANPAKEESLAVFVGGFPFHTSEATLQKDFAECGEITKILIPKDAEGKRRGIAFITFKTKAGVEAACKFDRTDYGGRILMVNKVGPPKKGKGDKGKGKGEKGKGGSTVSFDHEVCVRGLPWSTTSEQLKKHFEECGEVENFKLLYNEEGKVRGSAFIAFKNEEGLKKAL